VVHKDELKHLCEKGRRSEEGSQRAAPMADGGGSGEVRVRAGSDRCGFIWALEVG
jgi:hypothetical protein